MRRLLLVPGLVAALSAPAGGGPGDRAASTAADPAPRLQTAPEGEPAGRSPRNANYTINVRLDPATRTLVGEETITWRNIAPVAATELRFHLYYNAWRNTQSTWMLERALAGASDAALRRESDWGWIDLSSARLLGAGPPADVTSRLRFIAPDDGNVEDRTVVSLPLDTPVAPGETINVQIGWTSRVPRTFARTGAIGDFFFLAQWFPKIGVLEDTGWNCHQFHAATEFYADFGVYDVQMTVPAGWVVGATGVERERRDLADGTTTHRYYQEDVHDFAWTTSPHYLERRARFEHPALPPVDMRLLLQPEHAGQAARHFDATRAALKYYGEWFGPYPYGHVTVIDPAWQSGAGGMEYPTLFTAGTRWLAPERATQPESVTVHEAGHQFWYGIVANNEFEHAWLDEGLNTFSTGRTLEEAFPPNFLAVRFFGGFVPWVLRDVPLSRTTTGNRLSSYRPAARADAQSRATFEYWPGTASAITYAKTSLWLHTLERRLGWPVLQRILAAYFQRWAFRHPRPDDFFAVANEIAGEDLGWFFDEVHRSSNVFDYAVEKIESAPADARGFFDAGGRPAYRDSRGAGGRFATTVVVRRRGEAVFPVDVLVAFENGQQERRTWDGLDRWTTFRFEGSSRAVSAQVDPDRVLLLDVDYTNNSVTLRPRAAEAATKWASKWMVWLQDLMLTAAFFV
jgi:hypothetical protein